LRVSVTDLIGLH